MVKKTTRLVIDKVSPEIDCGRFPVKRFIGDTVVVEADIFADGHDSLCATLLYRYEHDSDWSEVPVEFLVNDRWRASFKVTKIGRYYYTLIAWIDYFETWRRRVLTKIEANQPVEADMADGIKMIRNVQKKAGESDSKVLESWTQKLNPSKVEITDITDLLRNGCMTDVMRKYIDKKKAETYRELQITVNRKKARFSTWYEMFPRSCSKTEGEHGTFKDCEDRLEYIAEMGFDVLYLPPIHPIGFTNRKGKNNSVVSQPGDPGTPWAIGSHEGGHKAIHLQLGTIEDFKRLVESAAKYDIEIALDLAYQCSPDHPYVKEHPHWFRRRPDGSIQYAENPPKKYEDIYPIDFETNDHSNLWLELRSIVLFWIEHGIRIFRVDNPHTKPFVFWEWLINGILEQFPDVIFLSEAFTRPKIMYRLAKLGFTQSYTYFTWRNEKWELEQYFEEVTHSEVNQFFNPNLWPNTPDILSNYLRDGGKPAFMARLVLAATLGANYGIYGPAFELCMNIRKDEVSEEYLDAEKYEIKHDDIYNPGSLKDFIARVNRIRKENIALQQNIDFCFHKIDNEQLICYSKQASSVDKVILVIVNLDYRFMQSGWVELDLERIGLEPNETYAVHDLLSDAQYQWHGNRNYVELDPNAIPAHIFGVIKKDNQKR